MSLLKSKALRLVFLAWVLGVAGFFWVSAMAQENGQELLDGVGERNGEQGLDLTTSEIIGDPGYGEYLSGECSGCHQLNGKNDGIPAITGWKTKDFIVALLAYKLDRRTHPVMQMMAKRLTDEDMAALAAYFEKL